MIRKPVDLMRPGPKLAMNARKTRECVKLSALSGNHLRPCIPSHLDQLVHGPVRGSNGTGFYCGVFLLAGHERVGSYGNQYKHDLGRKGLCNLEWEGKFKTLHMPFSSGMSTVTPLARVGSSRLLACPKQYSTRTRSPSYHSCMGACFQEELTSCLTRVAISEKVSQPPSVESL
ncbi:hypothetical protein TNCV_2876571 [Trichonephila clavipes]|nr:hypothetical protein TNCV_2876571 [Trichonephila clavipes]